MPEVTTDRLGWFQAARFGMFIHWGPYAVQQNGEWSQNADEISTADYEVVADGLTAELFDAEAWVLAAKRAGMRYVVLTTKHHDGFCLWNTSTTDWNAVRRGPRRDVVAEFVAACRRHGLRVGLYWSWVDWHQADWAKEFLWSDLASWRRPLKDPVAQERLISFLHAQVRELMSNYGTIDILWFDGGFLTPEEYRSREMLAMVRQLQPGIVVNNRAGLDGDFGTPEGCMPETVQDSPWELCHCSHTSWGYQGEDAGLFQPDAELLALLCDSAALGGNFLLNFGPRPDGTFAAVSQRQLATISRWMELNGEAIHGSSRGPFGRQPWGVSTRIGSTVYLLITRPFASIDLHGVARGSILRAKLLAGGATVACHQLDDIVRLDLPWSDAPLPLVVALEFVEPPIVAQPGVIPPLADGSFLLTANQAQVANQTGAKPDLTLSADANGGRLVNWKNPGDQASWTIIVPEAGIWRVAVDRNLPDTFGMYGHRFEVVAGDGQRLRAAVTPSGSLHAWSWYALAGALRLPAGRQVVIIRPYVLDSGYLMNLRAVRLERID